MRTKTDKCPVCGGKGQGMTALRQCEGCRFWSEMVAWAKTGSSEIEALCLHTESPQYGRMARNGCDERSPGLPIDAPRGREDAT